MVMVQKTFGCYKNQNEFSENHLIKFCMMTQNLVCAELENFMEILNLLKLKKKIKC